MSHAEPRDEAAGAEPFRRTVRAVCDNPWVLGLAASPLLITLGALVYGMFDPRALFATLHPTILALVALNSVLRNKPWSKHVDAALEVDKNAVRLDGEAVSGLDDIKDARMAVQSHGATRVQMDRGWFRRSIDVEVATPDDGRDILRALGHDASQRVANYRTLSWLQGKWWRGAAVMFSCFAMMVALATVATSLGAGQLGALSFLPMVLGVGALLYPGKVSVGTDGVLVSWLWKQRLIDLADIASVHTNVRTNVVGMGKNKRTELRMGLHNGEVVTVAVPFDGGRANQLAQRIKDAIETRASGSGAAVAQLRRPQGSTAAWLKRLRVLMTDAGASHRRAPVRPQQLWRVVEDAGASPADRAAAAMALHDHIDPGDRQRLRAAAEVTAAPKLRIALDAAADESLAEEELAAALEEAAEMRLG